MRGQFISNVNNLYNKHSEFKLVDFGLASSSPNHNSSLDFLNFHKNQNI